jgi:hypothetical protein
MNWRDPLEQVPSGSDSGALLRIERLDPVPAPLAAQTALAVPDALRDVLFEDQTRRPSEGPPDDEGGGTGPLHTYAVIDGVRVPNLAEILPVCGLEARCLFLDGEGEDLVALAPWLVRLEDGHRITRALFTDVPGRDVPWELWRHAPALYLRSRLGIDRLRSHLRRFVRVGTDDGRLMFFRFWDSRTFEDFLVSHADDGALSLFRGIHSFVVYHRLSAARILLDGPVPEGRLRLSAQARQHYASLRTTRQIEAIAAHIGTLAEFRSVDPVDLLGKVRRFRSKAVHLGLADAREIFTFVLGLCLSENEPQTVARINACYGDTGAMEDDRRRRVMAVIEERIGHAKAEADRAAGFPAEEA